MTDSSPDATQRRGQGTQHADVERQVALLRAEIRRLSIALDRQAEAARAQVAHERAVLQAQLAHVTSERDIILASRTWHLALKLSQITALLRKSSRGATAALEAPPTLERAEAEAEPAPVEDPYQRWIRQFDRLTEEDRDLIRARIRVLTQRPQIAVLIGGDGPDADGAEATRQSLEAQLYPDWHLCDQIQDARGEFVAFLPAGDILAEHALYEIAEAIEACPDASMVFTDEDRVDEEGNRTSPRLKPAYNIDQLLGMDMVGGLAVYRRRYLDDMATEASPDAAYLRALKLHGRGPHAAIRHVPAVLYHRRAGSPAAGQQTEIANCFLRQRPEFAGARAVALAGAPGRSRVIWPLPDPPPRVSLIVPTRDRAELLCRCVAGLLHRTDYPDIELLILDNESIEAWTWSLFDMLRCDPRVRILPCPGPFNYSTLNNEAVRQATGEIIVLLNNDIDVIDRGWLRELVSHAVRPDVGAVGAKLVFADERIQHAGIVLGVGPEEAGTGIAGHFGYRAEASEAGYLGQFAVTREVSAVTGACLAMRREVYQAVGGLNETDLAVAYNDVDLCLRIKNLGLRIIWTPFAELYHLESATRGGESTPEASARAAAERRFMLQRWGGVLAEDPFYNENFSRQDHDFVLAWPPRRRRPWR